MKGEPDSELALSGWYLTGAEGVLEQNDTEAYLWARRAGEKGLMKAEYAVGHLTEAGFGVAPNLEEAKRWYYKAASGFYLVVLVADVVLMGIVFSSRSGIPQGAGAAKGVEEGRNGGPAEAEREAVEIERQEW